MVRKISRLRWVLALVVILVSQSSCEWRRGAERKENHFREVIPDDLRSIDPANAFDSISYRVVGQIYETLYQYDYLSDPLQYVPLLAAGMPEYSPDQRTVTIRLRSGIRYQDDPCFEKTQGKGREVVASDFVYAWKRLADPAIQSNGFWIFDGKVQGFKTFQDQLKAAAPDARKTLLEGPISGISTPDDHTLVFQLEKAYPQLMPVLAMNFTSPVPREAVEKYGDEKGNLLTHAVGSGPFLLKSYLRGQRVELVRNPNFHDDFYPKTAAPRFEALGHLQDAGKKLPFLDAITFQVVKEQQPAWLGFLQGSYERNMIPKDQFGSVITTGSSLSPELKAKGIQLQIEPALKMYYVGMNMKDPLLGKNKLLRQAISSAIDREKWIELFLNGRADKMVTAVPPGIPDRAKTTQIKYDYHPDRARKLLAQAGYPGGKGLPVIKFDMRRADSFYRQVGEFFTQQLGAIGIQVEVILNTFPGFLEKKKMGNLQLFYGGWILDYPDPENVYQLMSERSLIPGPNDTSFNQPKFNELFEKMAVMQPGPARAKIIEQLDAILQEEVPWAFGYVERNYDLYHSWVKNYRSTDVIYNTYKYLRVVGKEQSK